MKRHWHTVIFILLFLPQGFSQIRLKTLTITRKEKYELRGTDIMVLDTLILTDSAHLVLNTSKKENFIHAKKIIIGKGCVIDGKAQRGSSGQHGLNGFSSGGPCREGSDGQSGSPGSAGKDAPSLLIYVDELRINGTLTIDLTGGDGGDGGKGGTGGGGNRGTKLCQGGNGGAGGDGAAGGNGGHAGNLTFTSKYGTDLRSWMGDKIIVRLYGGYAGQAGEGGLGGERGLGPDKEGNPGKKGSPGAEGIAGKPGGVFFQLK